MSNVVAIGWEIVKSHGNWHLETLLDRWPDRSLFRKFHTKRAAMAAKRMLEARACNEADAEIIIRDDARSFQRSQGMRLTDAEALHHAGEWFAIVFSFNSGLAFPGGRAFLARFCPEKPEVGQNEPSPLA